MSSAAAQKYGNLGVVRGGVGLRQRSLRQRSTVSRVAGRQEWLLDREMRDVFNAAVTPEGTRPSRAVQEIVEDRQWPWRKLARRIRELAGAGVPRTKALRVVRLLEVYVNTIYQDIEEHDQQDRAA